VQPQYNKTYLSFACNKPTPMAKADEPRRKGPGHPYPPYLLQLP
jgi:hypothetical protein